MLLLSRSPVTRLRRPRIFPSGPGRRSSMRRTATPTPKRFHRKKAARKPSILRGADRATRYLQHRSATGSINGLAGVSRRLPRRLHPSGSCSARVGSAAPVIDASGNRETARSLIFSRKCAVATAATARACATSRGPLPCRRHGGFERHSLGWAKMRLITSTAAS